MYKLTKSLVLILRSFTSNKYTMKDSFPFPEEIVEQDSEFFFFKGSLDVDSLLTDIPLGIWTNPLFKYTEREEGLSKIEFNKLYIMLQKSLIY